MTKFRFLLIIFFIANLFKLSAQKDEKVFELLLEIKPDTIIKTIVTGKFYINIYGNDGSTINDTTSFTIVVNKYVLKCNADYLVEISTNYHYIERFKVIQGRECSDKKFDISLSNYP